MAKHYLKARHLMLDIETLDTRPSAAVLSIGAVSFSIVGGSEITVYRTAVWRPSLREQLVRWRRTVSADTQEWWAKPGMENARAEVITENVLGVNGTLNELADFVGEEEPDYVWAQGASFDFPILQELNRVSRPADSSRELWPFWIERDCRTVLGLPEGGVDREAIAKDLGLVAHDAVDDCLIQAYAMARVLVP